MFTEDSVPSMTISTDTTSPMDGVFAGLGAGVILFYAAFLALSFIATYKIAQRAGYSGWLALTQLIPVVGIVFFFLFAFKTWPVERELEWARAAARNNSHRASIPPRQNQGDSMRAPLPRDEPPSTPRQF